MKSTLRTTSALTSIALAALAAPALAQSPAADETAESGIAEIIVTAQKVSQNAQDVPIRVDAHSG